MITGNDTGGEFSGIRGVGTEPQGLIRRGVCRRQTAAPPRNVRWGLFLPACAPGGSTRTGSSSAPLWRRRDTWLNRAPTQARKDKRLHAGRQVCTHASTHTRTHALKHAHAQAHTRTHAHTHGSTYARTHTRRHPHANTRAQASKHTHVRTHAHTHTHTHIHTQLV